MNKQIITISRQCGSGGHTIGQKVAERLEIPFYDKRILEIVSQRSGLSEETVELQGEYASTSLLHSLARNISYGYNLADKGSMVLPDQIFAFQSELIRELADKESCVIVGRCADHLLHNRVDCLHVFIVGDVEDRRQRVIAEHRVPTEKAESHVRNRDKLRSQHYKHYTDHIWGMAENYDLCLNSSQIGIDSCVEMICNYCLSKQFK